MIENPTHPDKIVQALLKGQLVVMRTDTIYGILASVNNPKAIDRLYSVRRRSPDKGSIILLSSIEELPISDTYIKRAYEKLNTERPTTIIVPARDNYLPHAHREKNTLAFRVVNLPKLQQIIAEAGPVLAPSANPEGSPPAQNIQQAMQYFGDKASLYVDGGEVTDTPPSRIVEISAKKLAILRG